MDIQLCWRRLDDQLCWRRLDDQMMPLEFISYGTSHGRGLYRARENLMDLLDDQLGDLLQRQVHAEHGIF